MRTHLTTPDPLAFLKQRFPRLTARQRYQILYLACWLLDFERPARRLLTVEAD